MSLEQGSAACGHPGPTGRRRAARRRLPRRAARSRRLQRGRRLLRDLRLRHHRHPAAGADVRRPDRPAALLRAAHPPPVAGARADGDVRRGARHAREPAGDAAHRSADRDRRIGLRRERLPLPAPDRLLRRQRDARSAPAHMDARRRGAVLPRLPCAPDPRLGLHTRRSERGRRLGTAAIVAAVSVVSYVLAVKLAGGWAPGGLDSPESFGFYSSPTRAWEFGLGALVALAAPWLAKLPARSAAIAGGAGLGAIALTAFAIRETSGDPRDVVLAVVGTCAVLLAGAVGRGPVTRLLETAPAVWVGNLSYSWYLWHWPLIVFARALWPGGTGVAIAAAAVSLAPAGSPTATSRTRSASALDSGAGRSSRWRRRASPCPSGLRRCSSVSTTCCCEALPSRPGRRHGCSMRIRRAAAVPRSKNRACGRPKRGVG